MSTDKMFALSLTVVSRIAAVDAAGKTTELMRATHNGEAINRVQPAALKSKTTPLELIQFCLRIRRQIISGFDPPADNYRSPATGSGGSA